MTRFISFIFLIVVLLLASFLYLVRQPFVQEQLKTTIKNYVQRELLRTIEFKSVELSLVGPSIIGSNIRLFNETEDLSFDSVKARISLLSLFKGRLAIASVTASHGKIVLSKNWKAPQFKSKNQKENFSLVIPKVYFRNLAFQYQNDSQSFYFREADMTAKTLWGRVDVDFETPFFSFETKNGKREDVHILAQLTVDPHRLRVHKLKILDKENFLNSEGTIYFTENILNFDLQLRAECEIADYHFLSPKIDFLKGKVAFQGKLKENNLKPKIQADVSSEEFWIYNQNLSKFTASFTYSDDHIDISRFSVSNIVGGQAQIKFKNDFTATGSAELSNFPLETITILKSQGISGLGRGKAAFDLTVGGDEVFTLKLFPELEVSDWVTPLKEKFNLSHFALSSEVIFNHNFIKLTKTQVKIDSTLWNSPSLEISLKDKTINGSIETSSFDWNNFKIASWAENILGHGKAAIVVKGPLLNPFIVGKLDLVENQIEKLKLSHIDGNIKYQAPWLLFENLKLSSADSHLFLKGRYNLEKKVFEKSVLEIESLFASDIESFGYKLPFDFKGSLRGETHFYGPLSREGLHIQSHVVGEHAKIAQESFDYFQLNLKLEDSIFSIADSFLDKGEGRVFLNGRIFKDNQCHIKFWTKNLVSESFDVIAKYPFIFSSDIFLEGVVEGDFSNPAIKTNVEFKNASLNGDHLPTSTYVLTLKDKKLEIQGSILEQQARLEASLTLSENMPFELYLKGKDFDFKLFYGLWRGYVSDGSGTVNGDLRFKGTLGGDFSDPKINYADVNLDKFEFKLPGYSLVNEKKFSLKYDNQFFEIQGVSLKGTDTAFTFSGKTDDKGYLNFFGRGQFNVAFLPLFFKEFEFGEGLLNVELSITGNQNNPELKGSIATQNSTWRSRSFDQTFDKINLHAILENEKLKIQTASFKIGEGSGSMEGSIDFPRLFSPQYNLKINLTKSSFAFLAQLRLKLGGSVLVEGGAPLRIGGDINIYEAHLIKDIDWKNQLAKKEVDKQLSSQKKQKPIDLNLNLKFVDKTKLESSLLNAKLRGELTVKGNTQNPILVGHVETIDGAVTFKDHIFKINSGEVAFQDQEKINPSFKFNVSSKIRKYEVQVSGSGTLNEYELQFQSDPPLPQADVVSLITLGVLVSELEGNEALGATSIEAASLLFSEFQERFKFQAKEKLGVDFKLSSSFSDTRHAVRPRIFVSKDIGTNLEVSFSSTLDKENIFEDKIFNLEWKLNRGFSLLGVWEDESQETQDANSALGLDMKFKYEFR